MSNYKKWESEEIYVISLLDVSKIYKNGHLALNKVSLEIPQGNFCFICGQSGAGKSTLIKLLFREDTITDGMIMVNDRDLVSIRPRQLILHRRSIGMVFQDYRLLPNKNVYKNVAFAMEVTGASTREIRRRVPEVLEMVGLSDKKKYLPSQLSGGEQQRVAVARALVNSPKIIFADEPTGNLDPQNTQELMEIFEKINNDGTTVLMATHAKDVVNEMKKRVIMLKDGEVVYDRQDGGYDED